MRGVEASDAGRTGLSDKRSFSPVPRRAGTLPRLAAAEMEIWLCFPFEIRASLCRQEPLQRGGCVGCGVLRMGLQRGTEEILQQERYDFPQFETRFALS